jgi:hypothetical protein
MPPFYRGAAILGAMVLLSGCAVYPAAPYYGAYPSYYPGYAYAPAYGPAYGYGSEVVIEGGGGGGVGGGG